MDYEIVERFSRFYIENEDDISLVEYSLKNNLIDGDIFQFLRDCKSVSKVNNTVEVFVEA